MWTNRVAAITVHELNAADVDSPPEKLQYTVVNTSNGYVGLKHQSQMPITHFTQADVDNGMVVFVRYPSKRCL